MKSVRNHLFLIGTLILVSITVAFGGTDKNSLTKINGIPLDSIQRAGVNTKSTGDTLLFEGFESYLEGWTVINTDLGVTWAVYDIVDSGDPLTAHSGAKSAGIYYTTSGNDDWLITPKIQIPSNAESVSFSFWAYSWDSDWLEDFNVKISTSGTSISDFTVSLDAVTDVPAEWTQYTYDLSDYAGETIYLTVQCVSVDDFYLFVDDFILTAEGGSTEGITSTTSGGNWSESTTWIGGVVPTASDNVIINGEVVLDQNSECNDLFINAGKILRSSTGFYQNLTVNGNLSNSGTIQNNDDTDLNLILKGNLNNNGTIQNDDIMFNGTTNQNISMTTDAVFQDVHFGAKDSTVSVILNSDMTFTDCEIDFDWSDETTRLIIPEGSGFVLKLNGENCFASDIIVEGNGNDLYMSHGAYLYQDAYLRNIMLTGTVRAGGQSVTFAGDSVVVVDTLQSRTGFYNRLYVNSALINYGIIKDVGNTELYIKATGNLINYGQWQNDKTTLEGTIDQEIMLKPNQTFSSIVNIEAMIGTADFQWYLNSTEISGATSDHYSIEDGLTEPDYGTYYCSTNEGNSRKIIISGESSPIELTANFSADVTSGYAPLTVQFTDQSTGTPTSWNWDFGDGSTSTVQNPSHTYESVGSYTVMLTVSDGSDESSETKTNYITVVEPIDEPDGWFLQNPFPTADDLYDVAIIDDNTIVAIGPGGLIMKTDDGGDTWTYPQSGTTEGLNDVFFQSSSVGYIVGNNPTGEPGVMLKTTDGGDNWFVLNVNIEDIHSVYFIDENTGWIVGGNHLTNTYKYGYISKTTDGGQTWTAQTPAVDDEIYCVQFLDANIGWVSGYESFASTTDGGATWTEINLPLEVIPYNFHFVDQNNGWLPVGYDGLYQTSDGGATWTENTSYTGDNAHTICFTDVNTGYVNSEDVLYKTTDGGTSWTQVIDLPGYSDFYIRDIDFNSTTGWFVTTSGKIYTTEMDEWFEVSFSIISDNIQNAYFLNANTGWVVGYMDNIWKTTDGGYSWFEQETPAHYALEGIDFVNAYTGWAVGHAPYGGNAKIYNTTDGGMTWLSQESNTMNLLWDVDFIDGENGWAVGYQGTIIHTSDGGATWSEQSSGVSTTLEDVFFINANIGWICGADGTILHTTDGGNNWNQQTNNNTNNLNGIYFLSETNGFAVGAKATILRTTDGGNSWGELTTGSWDSPAYNSIQFADDMFGWIAGNDGTILFTENSGESWEDQFSTTSVDLSAVSFVSSATGWIVGDNGAIIKTSTSGKIPVTNIKPNYDNSLVIIEKYQLYQNYPNPFNPTTTIRYGLPETGQVRMTIFNLYGQKVVDLVNTTQNPGYYETIWNGKNRDGVSVSSGVYICYINVVGRTESYSKNIKMLLMK